MYKWNPLAGALAAFALAAGSSAQEPGLQMTNLGELRAPVFAEHILTGKAAAQEQLLKARAATKDLAFQEPVEFDAAADLQLTNMGDLRRLVFEGHKLSVSADGGPVKVLYAPSEADDAVYRAAIAAAIGGGATVDYFDTRVATPSVATLLQYDAVHTWANYAYLDNVTFGNNLASYNDQGGTVVLGVFCTYTTGNFLSGTIMTAAYCPVVSPSGTNHFTPSTYSGGGVTCIYNGVATLTSTYRDFLVTQGSGVADGSYADAEICHAYRGTSASGQGDVVYSNGGGGFPLGGTGQWGTAVGNSCVCSLTGLKILYAPSEADDAAYRAQIAAAAGSGATVDYFNASSGTPSTATLLSYDAVHTWANFAFADNVTYGNNLAAAVDGGTSVVMGAFCTYTSGNFLSGAIMTSAYSPVVSPSGSNHFSNDTDAGPFYSCVTSGVSSASAIYRDFLTTQGDGIIDSKFDGDKEIATAFRRGPNDTVGDVVYANGSGGVPLFPSGSYDDWPQIIVNGGSCNAGTDGPTASCVVNLGTLGNPNATSCGNTPVVAETWNVNVNTTPIVGTTTLSTFVVVGFGGSTTGGVVFGYELLILPPFVASQALGAHAIPIPPLADFIGESLSWQGARIEGNPTTVILTNGLNTVVGL